MARQIQIRRGSAAAHANFTGAVGEITMDTTNNTLRLHDGITPGGHPVASGTSLPETADYVIESWCAADGTSWYRKYKSGWVEQGGITTSAAVNFPVPFSNTNYTIDAIAEMIDGGVGTISVCYANKTATSISLQVRWNGGARDTAQKMWFACGF